MSHKPNYICIMFFYQDYRTIWVGILANFKIGIMADNNKMCGYFYT